MIAAGAALSAQTPAGLSPSSGKALQSMIDAQNTDYANRGVDETELLEKSREAGLLTDWHLDGRFGHGATNEFTHQFAPEKEASKQSDRRFVRRRYELVFPEGIFTLPKELADAKGVLYAVSSTYLTSGGDWNVYLDSGAEAVVFVDGRRAVTRGRLATGVLRGRIHIESGYHSVMVKFSAQAAPFRVAILPLNSGSRRKNNTPYLQASPASDDMLARDTSDNGQTVAGSF
jgi:hypothetical protein